MFVDREHVLYCTAGAVMWNVKHKEDSTVKGQYGTGIQDRILDPSIPPPQIPHKCVIVETEFNFILRESKF